jgi:nitric oxide dioxygenase
MLELICHKHASLLIEPKQYSIVGKYLIEAMEQVLGEAFTPNLQAAWTTAYWQLAKIMIEKEASLYQQSDEWTTWRDFRIANIKRESSEITSFYLQPVDGKSLPSFAPGQYISVRMYVPGLGYAQARQYSLSDRPNPGQYRISVKREDGFDVKRPSMEAHPGFVSNSLYDMATVGAAAGAIVQVSHPRGDFFLPSDRATSPVVLVAAGVGLTPLLSMFNFLAENMAIVKRKVHLIHAARSSNARAFKESITKTAQDHPSIKTTFFLGNLEEDDRAGLDYNYVGRVNLELLHPELDLYLNDRQTEYYICGPSLFMLAMRDSLLSLGVGATRIKVELFGTGGPEIDKTQANL